MSDEPVNPFEEAAAVGAAAEALRRLEWEQTLLRREAHLQACEAILSAGVLHRLQLAAEAVAAWGKKVVVAGVTRKETHTGLVHFRARLEIGLGTAEAGYLEFIASPKSMVIAAEGERMLEKRRWQKIALTADAISHDADRIISAFLTWGWEKRG